MFVKNNFNSEQWSKTSNFIKEGLVQDASLHCCVFYCIHSGIDFLSDFSVKNVKMSV